MAEHTPGPWKIIETPYDPSKNAKLVEVVRGEVNGRIARIVYYPGYNGECEANARLIVAAPEMCEMLQECVGTFRYDDCRDTGGSVIDEVRALLAKIKGE